MKVRKARTRAEYALYKGDELLAFGTAYEIANQLGMRVSSVRAIATPSYKKKLEIKQTEYKDKKILIRID